MAKKLFGLLVILSLLGFYLAYDVYPRAGGGQHYRSSSRSSSSSSRSSGSTTRSSTRSSGTTSSGGGYHYGGTRYYGGSGGGVGAGICGSCGCFAILLVIVVIIIILVIINNRKKKAAGGNTEDYRSEPEPQYEEEEEQVVIPSRIDRAAVDAGLAKLKETDPTFSEKDFLDRVQTAFYMNQKAWMERNLEIARGYMSDGVYSRWKMQIDELINNKQINMLEKIVIGGIKMAEVTQEGGFDSIKVRIRASMADFTIDETSKKIVSGSKEPRGFTEYWTFLRKAGTATPQRKEGYKSNTCPSCGAPLQIGTSGNCDFCGAGVSSTLFDWVLDSITQEGEDDD